MTLHEQLMQALKPSLLNKITTHKDRHIKGHSLALLQRLESLQGSQTQDKAFVSQLQQLNPQDND